MAMCLSLSLVSCSDDDPIAGGNGADPIEADAKYVGQAVGNFDKSEWYPGGELGTTNRTWLPVATRTRLQPWSSRDCLTTSTLERNSSSASLHLQLQDSAV